MDIGRKVYYELSTGNIILDTGERSGDVVETTVEQDFASYQVLSTRVPNTIGVLELDHGAYASDFASCDGVRVENGELLFTYPDPSDPIAAPVPRKSLSTELDKLKTSQALMQSALDELLLGGV